MENAPSPITDQINSVIARYKIRYFSFADVTVFRRPRPALLTGIVLRVPKMGERVFDFPNKRWGKNVFQSIFSTLANTSPVLFLMSCRNIHSD